MVDEGLYHNLCEAIVTWTGPVDFVEMRNNFGESARPTRHGG
jgi:hypothetical protein